MSKNNEFKKYVISRRCHHYYPKYIVILRTFYWVILVVYIQDMQKYVIHRVGIYTNNKQWCYKKAISCLQSS